MSGLLFPVGHYQGPLFRAGEAAPVGHRVRLGPSLRWLRSDAELAAWSTAHGLDDASEGGPMTADSLAAHTRDLAGVDVAQVVPALVERGLLVEVDPEKPDAVADFGKSHQLRPLMLALGPDPEEEGAVLLGTAGDPVVALSAEGYAMWAAAGRAETLWDACRTVAGDGDPGALLAEALTELPDLLGAGAAYLDAVEGEGRDADIPVD